MIIENGIVDPDNSCVYDRYGNFIKESCIIRDIGIKYKPKEKISVNCKYDSSTIVYGGRFPINYGHFMTEGSSRLWYPTNVFYYHSQEEIIGPVADILELSNLKFNRITEKIQYRKIILPKSSFRNRLSFSSQHRLFFEKISERLTLPSIQKDSILYLSRKNLPNNRRKISNEDEIESLVKFLGGTVVYPETLSVIEQIELINKHSCIAGCLGAAFHTLLFKINKPKNIFVFWRSQNPKVYPNYVFIDKIKGFQSNYIRALSPLKNNRMTADIKTIREVLCYE